MNIYVALLRGINVGGKNIIKRTELKQIFTKMGLYQVQTYIQSGNVLFKSEAEEESLRERIEQEIETVFGFSVPVVLRKFNQLKTIVMNCPFSDKEISAAEASAEGESLYVGFMLKEPSREGIERLKAIKSDGDQYHIEGTDVFLLFCHSIRKSKLANSLEKLDVPITVRNWKTINKLVALASTMDTQS